MPLFPKRVNDLVALLIKMITGYTTNPGVFPHANVPALQVALTQLNDAITDMTEKEGAYRQAVVVKDLRQEEAEEIARAQLQQSEVDTRANPSLLQLIGWGPKKPKTPIAAPGQPRDFAVLRQGKSWIDFDWKSPNTGGKVRIYRLERRQQPAGGGDYGDWAEIGTFIKTKAHVADQPRGVQMEYHIVAINGGGESVSGVVDVVL